MLAEQSQKILIRGVNWIGDAVLTLPAIKAIRKAYPCAHISLLVKPWVSEIFKENPDIDEIILYEDTYKSILGKLKLAEILRQKKFNCSILLQNAFDAVFVTWLAKIPVRIGYASDMRRILLTEALPVHNSIHQQHQVFYYLNLIKSAGIETAESQPYLCLSDDERKQAKTFFLSAFNHSPRPIIGINPGGTYGSAKRWLPERFAALILRIIHELDGNVVIFGSKSELEMSGEIFEKLEIQNAKLETRILTMTGKTNLRELAALIAECDAFITNDSGPMHMASALLVPTVAIFGSTNRATTGPFGQGHRIVSRDLPCAPCMKRECPEKHLNCMTEITADEVFTALKEVLPHTRAVFLDRDGTLIEDKNYLNSFDDLVIFPYTEECLQVLKEEGFKLIGITNQSGIARKIVDEDFIIKSNTYLKDKLGIDDFYYCPHHPDVHCPCRKPEPMLLLMARIRHGVRLKDSFVIGDKESDVLLAEKVGARGILLAERHPESTKAYHVARNLKDAVAWMIEREKEKK